MSLPRLLAGVDRSGAASHAAHVAVHGDLPPSRDRARRGVPPLIDEIRASGLTGRGGAGFPTATKLAAVLGARGRPVVVANCCEGEPASRKDRLLLEAAPHLIIDGALACAQALDAERILFAVSESSPGGRWAIQAALAMRPEIGRRGPAAEVAAIPAGYVSGQETAIVSFVNRGVALPTAVPPMVYERGVGRRPTLVANAETLSHVALIARHGADWFREVGTDEQPGSALVTLGGAVAEPGVFEIEHGTSVGSLIAAGGGTLAPPRAILVGGYGGTWVDADRAGRLRLSTGSLEAAGASLGPGVIVVLPDTACPVAETARIASWLDSQGASQCGPCVNGLAAIAGALWAIADGRAEANTHARLARWSELVTRRGACGHPDGAARFVMSALDVFADEFADHAAHGRCQACFELPVLPLPGPLPIAA